MLFRSMALTDCLAQHGANPQGLFAYEQRRLQPGQSVVERARVLGAYMQAHADSRLPGMSTNPLARNARDVMMQTAVDLSETDVEAEAEAEAEAQAQT